VSLRFLEWEEKWGYAGLRKLQAEKFPAKKFSRAKISSTKNPEFFSRIKFLKIFFVKTGFHRQTISSPSPHTPI